MAAETLAIAGVQTLVRGTDYTRRFSNKSQSALLNFPVKANCFGGSKPFRAAIVHPRSTNYNGVSNVVPTVGKGNKGMTGWHDIELMVREYELDQYGVVNNGVYSNYCQLAHSELLKRIAGTSYGIDLGEALALTELSLKFIAPLKNGDRFLLRVRISDISGVRLSFQDSIIKLPDQQPILEANATVVYLDKNYKPVRLPQDVRSKVNQFIAEKGFEQD